MEKDEAKMAEVKKKARDYCYIILFIIISNTVLFFNLEKSGSKTVPEVLLSKDGERIPVIPGAVNGSLDYVIVRDSAYVEFRGWAFDAWNSRLPDAILLYYYGKNIYWGQNNRSRPDVANVYGREALESGFKFVLPLKRFKDKELNSSKVRLFAVSNGVASELNYSAGFK